MSDRDYTIPSHLTAKELGKVNVSPSGNEFQIQFTILMEPQGNEAEGWTTGVALDGSASMKGWYGRMLEGKVPDDVIDIYDRQGWMETRQEDGHWVQSFQRDAYEDAIQRGYLKSTTNIVEPLAQQFIAYLAGNLDEKGGSTVIYWGGGDGSKLEVLGDFTEEECQKMSVRGPTKMTFGMGTSLTPAVQYFVDRFSNAKRGMYVFITDGKLYDLPQVKRYTTQLAKAIASGKRNPVKCVLVGVGDDIDAQQMTELDDLDTGTNIDIWDSKIATEMRAIVEIFAEVVSENQIVAPTATLYDASGNTIKKYTDGLPAKVSFAMPKHSQSFVLEVMGNKIQQSVVVKSGVDTKLKAKVR